MSHRASTGSRSSASSPPLHTPSSTSFVFGEQRATSPSFSFGAQNASRRTTPATSTSPAGTMRFTSSPTPFTSRHERGSTPSFSLLEDHDPDKPLPSVERDNASAHSRQSTPSTTQTDSVRQASAQNAVLEEIGDLRNLRLTSPQEPASSSSSRDTPTPSIHVTPSAPPDDSGRTRGGRTDSLVDGITSLRMNSLQADPGVSGLRESQSPSPSRRRRSGSRINKETHRIEDEEPPETLFHMPEVQEALATARTLTSRMNKALSSSNLHRENGSSIQNLYQRASRLKNFQLPSSRIVGLVGDSGVGKSSLINSLLDKIGLARASNSGTACTCAVTEYLFHDRDDFIISVDYFSLEELKKQFEELLRAYRDYESLSASSRGRNEDDDNDNERRTLKRKADLADQTFTACFGEKYRQAPTLRTTMPFDRAVEMMIKKAAEILPTHRRQESFSTVEACSARLRELTSESSGSTSGGESQTRWPFIQKLQVYLNAYILSKGLIIADLPGLRDLNSARKAITERYVRQCHQIFVVARIDRAITDESIKEIFELASRARLSKVDIICTRSEDVNRKEAKHDWPSERAEIEEMENNINAQIKEIELLKEEIEDYEEDDALSRGEKEKLLGLQKDCRKAEKSKENYELESRRHLVNLRNKKVSQSLREAYQHHSIARSMKTFCVSNTYYWDNREKPATVALPYLKLSGILELRRHCIGIVAESRLRATREFIKDEIPAFLGSVQLWVEAGSGNASAEKKQHILDAAAIIQRELDKLTSPVSELNDISRTLIEEFNNQIDLRMRQGGPQWMVDARQASYEWQGWHHSSYKAFCSNYGEHSTPKMGYQCWNEQAIESMKEDMTAIWDDFAADLEEHVGRINSAVIQSFDTVRMTAMTTAASEVVSANNPRSAMSILANTMRHRKDLTLNGVEEASEGFHSDLFSLHTDAFSSIRTAFIGKLMQRTYHAANMEYGSGSDRRRKNLITGGFGSPSLFNEHRRICKEGFRDIARELQGRVNDAVGEQVGLVEIDLQMLKDENVVLESEKDPKFRRRLEVEVQKIMEEVDRIGRVVEDAS